MKGKITGAVAAIAGFLYLKQAFKRTIPKGVKAIKNFNLKKYLGTWYEIARFDYRFERNMNQVTATYSLREDGKIKVKNRGFDYKNKKWKESVGKALPADDQGEAKLKVSFFWNFYAGYNVIAIDKDYRYAMVAGDTRNYLWILSREKTIPDPVKKEYVALAEKYGFNTSRLIWINQNAGTPVSQ